MKKYLYLITLSLLLVSCGKKEVETSKLQEKNIVYYEEKQQEESFKNGSLHSKADFSFSEGLVTTVKDGKYGFIDKNGNVVIPFKYDFVHSFKEGKAYVEKGEKSFLIDKDGKILVENNN